MKSPSLTLTFLQFLLSLLAAFLFFTLSAGLVLLGVSGWLTDLEAGTSTDQATLFLWATGLSTFGLLVLPSALFALLKWTGRPYPGLQPGQRLSTSMITLVMLVIVFPAALALGWLASQYTWSATIVLPLIHVLAVGIPILWLGLIGLRGLRAGSPQRLWGVFAAGLVLGPAISILLEILAGILIFIAAAIVLSADPELVSAIENLVALAQQAPDPNLVLEYIQPLLTHPWVIGSGVLLIAVITPIVEETFKPIGVYLLLHRRISPAEGFAAGLINGLGFALFESLLVSAGAQEWLSTVLLRAPTAALHGFTTALVGYGLASAFTQKRYLRLAVCYGGAVALHGVWNGLTLLIAGYSIQAELPSFSELAAPGFTQIIPLLLVLLAGVTFLGIVLFNHRFNHPVQNTGNEVT